MIQISLSRRTVVLLLLAMIVAWTGSSSDGQSTQTPQDRYADVGGIRLHYLDWGGDGPVMLMIPGLWSTAHSYDELAPRFTDRYHVVAVTRREHGSSQKDTGPIALDLLVGDLSDFLALFTDQPAVIVGHSYAGVEMPEFARRHPDQVAALVFLDAVYDWTMWTGGDEPPFPAPWAFPSQFDSFAVMEEWFSTFYAQAWGDALRSTLRSQTYLAADGTVQWQFPWASPKVADFKAAHADWTEDDLAGIDIPVLSLQADFEGFFRREFERWDVGDVDRRAAETWSRYDAEAKRRGRDQLIRAVPHSQHDLLADTHHWLFMQRPAEVAARMDTFLASLDR